MTHRYLELDALRLIAALMVVFFHYTYRGYAADNMSDVPFLTLAEVTRYGYLGVDLFFVISGFVILMSAQHGNEIKFTISRIVRIYPTFWVSVTLTALVMAIYNKPPYEVTIWRWFENLPLIGGYVGVRHLDGVYWSLLVELKFYFLVFLLLMFRLTDKIEHLLLGWIVVSILLTLVDPYVIGNWRPGFLYFFLFPEWSHYFIAGAAFYRIRIAGSSLVRWLIVALAFGSNIFQVYLDLIDSQALNWTTVTLILVSFYIVFGWIALARNTQLNAPWLLPLGALTYPLYLLHENIGFIVLNTFAPHVNKYLLLVLLILAMLGLSHLVNQIVEKNLNPRLRNLLVLLSKPIRQPL